MPNIRSIYAQRFARDARVHFTAAGHAIYDLVNARGSSTTCGSVLPQHAAPHARGAGGRVFLNDLRLPRATAGFHLPVPAAAHATYLFSPSCSTPAPRRRWRRTRLLHTPPHHHTWLACAYDAKTL